MTFMNTINELIQAEGHDLAEYEREAKEINEYLIYVVRFCKDSGIRLNYENVRGILIGAWSAVGDGAFNHPDIADKLILQVVKLFEG